MTNVAFRIRIRNVKYHCDYAACAKANIKMHKMLTHDKNKDYNCDQRECAAGANCTNNVHQKTALEEIRYDKCDQCEHAVGANYIITTHQKSPVIRLGTTSAIIVNTQMVQITLSTDMKKLP